jgi:phage protein D
MVSAPTVHNVDIKIANMPIEDAMLDSARVIVEESVHLPDMAILEFNDTDDLTWSRRPEITPGSALEINFIGQDGTEADDSAFIGEITAVESKFASEGSFKLIIRGYDRAHRLQRGRFTRVFQGDGDSDIATRIAQEVGLLTDVERTNGTHEYVLQDNQTNWEFLLERAARNGFEVQVKDRTLVFKPPPSTPRQHVELRYVDQELDWFRATMTTGEQVNEVEVRGWDPLNKQVIVGSATNPEGLPDVGESRNGGEMSQTAFQQQAKMLVSHQPIYEQQQADQQAQSILNRMSGTFITIEGVADGDPRVQVGSEIELDSGADRFDGTYYVTNARHMYEDGDYKVQFEASTNPSDIVSLLTAPKQTGMYVLTGVVDGVLEEDSGHPEVGRVKVNLEVLGDSIQTHWCRVATPGGGNGRGIEFRPERGDEVLLVGPSMDNLYVVGGLWNISEPSPLQRDAVQNSEIVQRVIRTRAGHQILFDDSQADMGITIVDQSGDNRIHIDSAGNEITIEAALNITITAGGDLKLEAQGNIDIDAGIDLTAKAQANASVEANAQAKLQGGPAVSVSGAQVSLG